MKFAIITENDISQWDDETGVVYHFPKRYLKFLQPETKVIYYKGKIKDKSFEKLRLSNNQHYFGLATIGRIYKDTNNQKNYYAEIEDYIPFNEPIYFKDEKNQYLEDIPDSKKSNYWRDGVRKITKSEYLKILEKASFSIEYDYKKRYKEC